MWSMDLQVQRIWYNIYQKGLQYSGHKPKIVREVIDQQKGRELHNVWSQGLRAFPKPALYREYS
jgi:hypothetical protein